jgi:hypothetical protein
MSRRNTKRKRSSFPQQENENTLIEVGTGVFTGLTFYDTIEDNVDVDQRQNCSPSINLYEDNKKAIINYQDCRNQRDLTKIDILFRSLVAGETFTLSEAHHECPLDAAESNLSGTYVFRNYFDRMISAEVSSVTKAQSYDKNYMGSGFLEPVQITADKVLKEIRKKYHVVNQLGIFSINIEPGDFVSFGGTNKNKNKRFKVKNVSVVDEKEEIEFYEKITPEDRVGEKTLVTVTRNYVDHEEERTTTEDLVSQDVPGVASFVGDDQLQIIKVDAVPADEGTGNVYSINGQKKPVLELQVGRSYVIDFTEIPTHALRFSRTMDGTHNDGLVLPFGQNYTNFVVIEPTETLVNTPIFYFCLNHPGMGGTVVIIASEEDRLRQAPEDLAETQERRQGRATRLDDEVLPPEPPPTEEPRRSVVYDRESIDVARGRRTTPRSTQTTTSTPSTMRSTPSGGGGMGGGGGGGGYGGY